MKLLPLRNNKKDWRILVKLKINKFILEWFREKVNAQELALIKTNPNPHGEDSYCNCAGDRRTSNMCWGNYFQNYDIAENMHWNFYPKWKKRLKLFGAVQKYINHQTTRFLKMKAKHHLEMRKYERTNQ